MLENHKELDNGIITQIERKPFIYDVNYHKERYESISEKYKQMSYLRYGYIRGVIRDEFISSVLDVGYGMGTFLEVCNEAGLKCYGNNIVHMPLPNGVEFVDNIFNKKYDIITFFDSLEHMQDINFLGFLKTKYVVISLPWCHYFDDDWFKGWRHRRTDEHLWYFNESALLNFMEEQGYLNLDISNIEDTIRKNNEGYPNILTGVFIKDES